MRNAAYVLFLGCSTLMPATVVMRRNPEEGVEGPQMWLIAHVALEKVEKNSLKGEGTGS